MSRRLKWPIGKLFSVVLAGFPLAMPATVARNQQAPVPDKIPSKVMDALKARFPNPEIRTWTREKEGDVVLYDIEFNQGGRKLEADIREDGTILNWEKEIPARDLPTAVMKTVNARYRNSSIKEVMETMVIKDGRDALEGYEIVLETAGKKSVEITVARDGKVLEDSADQK